MTIDTKPLVMTLLLGVSPLCAQADEFTEDDFFNELPVITSASRLNQSILSSPSAVTVIDSAMIRASGFIEIADIFRLVPGFQVAHADGNTFSVVNHGDGWEYPSRMQLLVDGRSTYTSALSAIDWNTLGVQIEDIDRIEIVRGPAASAYGANSFSGAINIITKAPELDNDWQLRTRFGNNGERANLIRHSGQLENLHYRLTAANRENGGSDQLYDSRDFNDVAFTARYNLDKRNAFFGHFSTTQGDAGMPPIDEGIFDTRKRDTDAISAHLRWDHLISDTQELKVNFYHNYRDEDDMIRSSIPLYSILGFPDAATYNGAGYDAVLGDANQTLEAGERTYKSHRSDLELQYNEILDSGLQYVVGFGGRYDTMESEGFFPDKGKASNTSFRTFGNVQVPLGESFTANAGGFYEVNRTEDPHFSPRLSISYHINDYQSLRATYSKAYRIPSLLEENMDARLKAETGVVLDRIFLANEDVKAEEVRAFDLGYVGRMQQFPLSWEVRAYKEEYDDVIDFYIDNQPGADDPEGELKRIGNVYESTMYGFEGSVMFRPEENSFIRFHFNKGHETGSAVKEINQPETEIISLENRAPRTSYGVLAAKAIGDWQFNVGLYHVGAMEWYGKGDQVDNYSRVDASIIRRVELPGQQALVFKLGGQNIGNNEYAEFLQDDEDDYLVEYEPRYYFSVTYLNF
jgi:iron complex outermembrane receptor protein